jgi:threonine/homoserine/homoserine lactone efflux protein
VIGLVKNILLGISLAAPVGPVSVEVIRRGLKGGFSRAFLVALGSALGDAVYLLVIYFGLAELLLHPIAKMSIWCFGALVLLILGVQTIRGAWKPQEMKDSSLATNRNAILAGFLLALINPLTIVWWLGVFGVLLGSSNEPMSLGSLLHNSTIILGVLVWFFCLSMMLHFGKRWISGKYLRLISVLAGLSLLGFGLHFGYLAIQILLQ